MRTTKRKCPGLRNASTNSVLTISGIVSRLRTVLEKADAIRYSLFAIRMVMSTVASLRVVADTIGA